MMTPRSFLCLFLVACLPLVSSQDCNCSATTAPLLTGDVADSSQLCSAPDPTVNVGVTSDCVAPLVVDQVVSNTSGCPRTLTREYSAEDACGRSASATQVITFTASSSTSSPTASAPDTTLPPVEESSFPFISLIGFVALIASCALGL